MFRFLLAVLVLGAIALAVTNPTTDDVRGQIDAWAAAQAGSVAAAPAALPAGAPEMPPAVTGAVSEKVQGQLQIARTNYYLFSVYKVSVGGEGSGTALPGCLIGIAKHALPYDKC